MVKRRPERVIEALVGVDHDVGRIALGYERRARRAHRGALPRRAQQRHDRAGQPLRAEVLDDDAGAACRAGPCIPATGVETTGTPAASASNATTDWPSEFEATTITSARAISARASGRAPVKRSTAPSSSSAASPSRRARSGPSPTTRKRASGTAARTCAAACRKRSGSLTATSRPTAERRAGRRRGRARRPAARVRRRRRDRRCDAVVDHAQPLPVETARLQRREQVLRHDRDHVGHAGEQACRRRPVGLGGAMVRGQDGRAARPAREPRGGRRRERRLGVVRVHDVGPEPPHRHGEPELPFGDADRVATALGQQHALDGRIQLRVERAGGSRDRHRVPARGQSVGEGDDHPLGPADRHAGAGQQDSHAAATRA